MGAWGAGAFQADAVLGFVPEIETAHDLARALTIRTPDEPVDADTACRIVLVAECVAAVRGHPCDDLASKSPPASAEPPATMRPSGCSTRAPTSSKRPAKSSVTFPPGPT